MKFWKSAAAVGILGAAVLIAGCGSSSGGSSGSAANEKTYIVATRGTAKPFSYVDDQGNMTGFDVEVLKEIDRRDPDIRFDFKSMTVASAFIAVDSGEADLVANQIRYTKARAAKYIYPKEMTNYAERRLVVRKDRNDIRGMDDLKGKKLAVATNSDLKPLAEAFNKTASPPIEILYTDKGASETLNLVATNRADAGGAMVYTARSMIEAHGWPLKILDEVISVNPAYFVLKKDEEHQKLADRIDTALKAMKEDGTLKALSEKYLGEDYITKKETPAFADRFGKNF